MKCLVYADFVIELSSIDTHHEEFDFGWVLSLDCSSNQQGNEAGVILEGPNGLLIEQALQFAFKASNNQTEYEALIAGILLAKEMGAQSLLAKSDSLLGLCNRRIPGQRPLDGCLSRICPCFEEVICGVRVGTCP